MSRQEGAHRVTIGQTVAARTKLRIQSLHVLLLLHNACLCGGQQWVGWPPVGRRVGVRGSVVISHLFVVAVDEQPHEVTPAVTLLQVSFNCSHILYIR